MEKEVKKGVINVIKYFVLLIIFTILLVCITGIVLTNIINISLNIFHYQMMIQYGIGILLVVIFMILKVLFN